MTRVFSPKWGIELDKPNPEVLCSLQWWNLGPEDAVLSPAVSVYVPSGDRRGEQGLWVAPAEEAREARFSPCDSSHSVREMVVRTVIRDPEASVFSLPVLLASEGLSWDHM